MLVPLKIAWVPSGATSAFEKNAARDRDDMIPCPGAEMSGLSAPSRRGPWLENRPIDPRGGAGLKQRKNPSRASQQTFVTCAATAMTESASPGAPTTPPKANPWVHRASAAPPERLLVSM